MYTTYAVGVVGQTAMTFLACGSKEVMIFMRYSGGFAARTTHKQFLSLSDCCTRMGQAMVSYHMPSVANS